MNRLCKGWAVLSVVVASVFGAMSASAADAPKPDINRGQTIATTICAACHGVNGNSPTAAFPKLAGQPQEYLVKQLKDFKAEAGKSVPARQNPVMAGIVTSLSDQDMVNVSAYFATQTPTPGVARAAATVSLGQRIYRGGVADKGVPACAACHGPAGQGVPIQYPRVSGQWADYLVAQLNAFQQGSRNNSEPMRQIASRLSDQEVKAVADYMAGLH
ncbi:MAG TPA: c-type cytochrome [Trinickia sp.]|jgi:cytochrome c553|uniref:c-type cytochrome n=1 Tax=Trinickia sp. TaxID=2571163 RepID=UPI002BF0E5D3|nr:c-type cytochrome [Trinickia sp.]HTI17658.1 c-type cytochrome [Trinickia sp.]